MSNATDPRPSLTDRLPPELAVRRAEILESRDHAPGDPDDAGRLEALLTDLYRLEGFCCPDDRYLAEHARPRVVRGQVRVFRWYREFLPEAGAVLDWGCNHAPDSCLLRAWAGDWLELHGCDFRPEGAFPAFHGYARLQYTPLADNLALPYAANRFDAVVASGVIEHAAMDYEALKELYRVLKPGGTLVVTYLPNRLSYQEWYLRNVRQDGFHRRVYGLGQAGALLRHCGFQPVAADYQSFLWEKLFGRAGSGPLGRALDLVLPARCFTSTLRLVARKVHGF